MSLYLLLLALPLIGQVSGPEINLTKAAGNQYETTVAINPRNYNQIFVAARNETGGLYTARSADGGVTWTSRLIGRISVPANGDIPRAYGNPSAAWDNFGNLFLAYLTQSSTTSGTYVGVSASRDAGATFYSPSGVGPVWLLPINSPGPPLAGDQPTVAVGPGSAGYPGSVWLTYWTAGGIVVSGAGVSGTGAVGPFTTWQPPQPPSVNFGDVAVGPSGEVIVTYGPNSGTTGTIYTNTKADGLGAGSFSNHAAVTTVNMGGFTHIPAQPNWGIDPEAGLAWDRSGGPHHGRIYLVYTDAQSAGSFDTDIFVLHSDDAGKTWSTRVRVNDDSTANSQFLPHLSVDQSNGTIAVTWYDARDSAMNATARYFGAFSTNGGETFGANFAISKGSSDQAKSPAALKKADYGDYTGNALANGRLVPAWADNSNSTGDNPDGPTSFDVYTAIVQAPGNADQQPRIFHGGVISAGAFGALDGIAPGTWIEIYGANLATVSRDWAASDFSGNLAPTKLDGVQVTVNGIAAAISHVGPGQVNAQVPDGIGTGSAALVVSNQGRSSDAVVVNLSAVLPGLLAPPSFNIGGKQYVLAMGPGGSVVGLPDGFLGGRPATPGEVVTLYGIGFGPVAPSVSPGTVTPVLNRMDTPATMMLDATAVDLSAPGTYAGLAPGSVGLYQFNIVVPNIADGEHRLRMTVGGAELRQNIVFVTRTR